MSIELFVSRLVEIPNYSSSKKKLFEKVSDDDIKNIFEISYSYRNILTDLAIFIRNIYTFNDDIDQCAKNIFMEFHHYLNKFGTTFDSFNSAIYDHMNKYKNNSQLCYDILLTIMYNDILTEIENYTSMILSDINKIKEKGFFKIILKTNNSSSYIG